MGKKNSYGTPAPDYDKVEYFHDPKVRSGKDWYDNGGNFAVKRMGKVYYVSPSVVVSMKAFCRNENGEWCILANCRGKGARTGIGRWNTPCGYLDYGESVEEAAVRETFEETGVRIDPGSIRFIGKDSGGSTVNMRFGAILSGTTQDYPLTDAYSEPGEVSDIQWIPLSQVGKYKWNAAAQLAHAKRVLGPLLDNAESRTVEEIVTDLYYEISNNKNAVALLKELLRQVQY